MSLYKAIGMMMVMWMLKMMMMMMMMIILWERFECKTTDRAEKAKTCEEPGGHLEKEAGNVLLLSSVYNVLTADRVKHSH